MARPSLSYGSRSLMALGVMLVATEAYHPGVLLLIKAGQNAAWLGMLIASSALALLAWPIAAVLGRMKSGNLIDMARLGLGPVGAIVVAVISTLMLTVATSSLLRQTAEMSISAAFPHTPATFATVAILLGSTFVAVGDDHSIVRLGRLLLPMLLFSILLVLAGSIGWGEWRFLAPFWGPGPGALLMRIPLIGRPMGIFLVLFLLTNNVADRSRLHWALPVSLLLSGLLLSAVLAIVSTTYVYPVATKIPFLLHSAARLLMGGRFFERLEGIWLFIWVSSTIALLGSTLHVAARAFARAFAMPRHTTAVVPLAGTALTLAFFPRDLAESIALHGRMAPVIISISFGIPFVVALIAAFRLRRGDR